MKLVTIWAVLFLPLLALGQNPQPLPSPTAESPTDLTTLSGVTYKAARIQTFDPEGITFFFAGGAVNIPFDDLPVEFRKYQPAPRKVQAAPSPGATAAPSVGRPEAAPNDPLGGGVIAGFTDDSVLLRMPNGSLVGKKLKDLDAQTLARIQAMPRPQPTAAAGSKRGNK